MSGQLSSSQVAVAAGVNLQTLRYYERRGLLPEPARSLGGHRRYDPSAVSRLRAVKAAQRLGFTLDEVAGLLDAGRPGGARGNPARSRRARATSGRAGDAGGDQGLQARAAVKLAEVEARIADLVAVAQTLRAAVDAGCDDLLQCAQDPRCPVPPTGPGADLTDHLA